MPEFNAGRMIEVQFLPGDDSLGPILLVNYVREQYRYAWACRVTAADRIVIEVARSR